MRPAPICPRQQKCDVTHVRVRNAGSRSHPARLSRGPPEHPSCVVTEKSLFCTQVAIAWTSFYRNGRQLSAELLRRWGLLPQATSRASQSSGTPCCSDTELTSCVSRRYWTAVTPLQAAGERLDLISKLTADPSLRGKAVAASCVHIAADYHFFGVKTQSRCHGVCSC